VIENARPLNLFGDGVARTAEGDEESASPSLARRHDITNMDSGLKQPLPLDVWRDLFTLADGGGQHDAR